MNDRELWDQNKYRFDQNISIKLNCTFMRTTFRVGMPLEINGKRFRSKWDQEWKQKRIIEKWIGEMSDKLKEQIAEDDKN